MKVSVRTVKEQVTAKSKFTDEKLLEGKEMSLKLVFYEQI